MEQIISYFVREYGDFGKSLLNALIIFIVGWYGVKILLHFVIKMMKRSQLDPIVINFVKSIINIGLKIIVIITAISQLGVNTASLVAVLTTAGAAIVLGLKDSMSGVVSGIIILFAKPFVKGDIVEFEGYVGKIQEIGLLYTTLTTFDNKLIVIPNNELASSTFVNYSHEEQRRVDLNINIHYESDVEKAKSIIMNVIMEHPYTLKDPIPYVRINEYQDSSIVLGLRVWTKTENYYDLKDDLIEQIKYRFDENGIFMPYNQLEIHLKNDKYEE